MRLCEGRRENNKREGKLLPVGVGRVVHVRHSHKSANAHHTYLLFKPDGRLVGVLHPVEQARPARLHLLLDVVPVGSDQGDARHENNVQPDDAGRIDPVGVAR